MSTNTQKYGIPIRAGWAWVLPNGAMDTPAIQTTEQTTVFNDVTQLDEVIDTPIVLSIRDYFNTPQANVGLFNNRRILPLLGGTHSTALFDSDIEDINGFVSYLNSMGLVDGGRDFTLDAPNGYYSMPITKYDEFLEASPLNVEPVIVEPVL